MALSDLFARTAKRMEFEIEDVRDAFTQGGVKGSALETSVIETVLRPYLPEKIAICTGQIVDALGATSKQLDVILFDRLHTPTLKRSGEIRLIPAECVFAVIEVKAAIKSKADIESVFANMESVRALSRKAVIPDPLLHFVGVKHYGKAIAEFPIHYSCFAFEADLLLASIKEALDEQMASRDHSSSKYVDMLIALKPAALWLLNGDPPAFSRAVEGREMTEYYLRLYQHLSMAMMAGFLDLDQYLSAR
jgi:hypothetical protein